MTPAILNHTMFRIKDAKKSLAFYTDILGMELLDESPGGDFTNYFLGFPEAGKENLSAEEKKATKTSRMGVLELCHNWGTESDSEFKGYSNGNTEPGRGFGHIAYSVNSVQDETDRLTKLGVSFKKRPEDGKMRHIAFILDPDNYWIEIVPNQQASPTAPILNHTMIRIKDPKVSLKFYTETLGMEVLDESPGGDFTNYFLGFPEQGKSPSAQEKKATKTSRMGVLELCHNWGTESDPEFKGYSNGNSEPGRGFGHIAYAVDSVQAETDRLTKLNVPFKKRPEDGRMRHIAFILDPDNYWIEIVPNSPNKGS